MKPFALAAFACCSGRRGSLTPAAGSRDLFDQEGKEFRGRARSRVSRNRAALCKSRNARFHIPCVCVRECARVCVLNEVDLNETVYFVEITARTGRIDEVELSDTDLSSMGSLMHREKSLLK